MNSILKSSIGRKFIMAATGLLLFLFVIGHLVGNLQIFGPPELINNYAHFLKSEPILLWGARAGLLTLVILHVITAIQLSAANKEARPVGYATSGAYGATWQSRYMLLSGLVVGAFVVYHLAHFTALLPGINGVGDFSKLKTTLHGESVADCYGMVVLGFQVWWVVLFYIVAQVMLFLHLGHGVSSACQSLGLRNHNWWPRIRCFTQAITLAILIGYLVIPISIFLRIVGAEYADQVRMEMKSAALQESAAPVGKEAAK